MLCEQPSQLLSPRDTARCLTWFCWPIAKAYSHVNHFVLNPVVTFFMGYFLALICHCSTGKEWKWTMQFTRLRSIQILKVVYRCCLCLCVCLVFAYMYVLHYICSVKVKCGSDISSMQSTATFPAAANAVTVRELHYLTGWDKTFFALNV